MLDVPTVFTDWHQLAIVCAVLVVAEAVYVAFGFGAGLITVGSLAMVLEVVDVVVIVFMVNLPVELWIIRASRKRVQWRGVVVVAAAAAVGTPLGAHLLSAADPARVLTALGGFLIVTGALFLALPERLELVLPRWCAPVAGLLSGALSGLYGTGGPPLIVYYRLSGLDKNAFRGTMIAVFLVIGLARWPSYLAAGLITEPRLWSSLAVAPAVIVGVVIGRHLHLEMSEAVFRRLVSVAVSILGVMLLLRG